MPLSTQGPTGTRSWFRARRNTFLRSIGFEIPFIFGYGKGQGETPKRVIDTTHRVALARCGVHVLPIIVSITIITFNWNHTYLGRTIPGSILNPSINIAFLQVVAKIQELAIVASVTTIVIHVLRSELIDGEGIPLGLLGGGFMFTGISYFWSPEFWGSTYTSYSRVTRTKIYGVIILGGIIAALAGPSTAVLLIPEDQPWSAGGTSIFLPGAQNQWSPSVVEADRGTTGIDCNSTGSINFGTCPSGGFPGLWSIKHAVNIYKTATYSQSTVQNITTGFSYSVPLIYIPGAFELLPTTQPTGLFRGLGCETSMQAPRVVEAMYEQQLMLDWSREAYAIPYQPFKYGPSLVEYKYYGTKAASSQSRLPAVRVACTSAQNITSSQRSVVFPKLPSNGCWSTIQNFSVSDVLPLSQNAFNGPRGSWISLPYDIGTVSAGFILELPWDTSTNSRPVLGCSIDARWTDGTVLTSETWSSPTGSSMDGTFIQTVSTASLTNPASTLFGTPQWTEFRPVLLSPSTNKTILDQSWLNALTPIVPEGGPGYSEQNYTTLEALLNEIGLASDLNSTSMTSTDVWNLDTPGQVNRTVTLEWWLSLFLIDGLSRTGSSQALNATGPVKSWSLVNYNEQPDFQKKLFAGGTALVKPNSTSVERKVTITIGGYSYMATAVTDWLSIALLLSHILLAVSHTVYCVSTGRSSSAWDTLTEMLILMQNSPQAPKVLRNANAGVKDILTYSHRARIYATRSSHQRLPNDIIGDGEISNVELIFDGEGEHIYNDRDSVELLHQAAPDRSDHRNPAHNHEDSVSSSHPVRPPLSPSPTVSTQQRSELDHSAFACSSGSSSYSRKHSQSQIYHLEHLRSNSNSHSDSHSHFDTNWLSVPGEDADTARRDNSITSSHINYPVTNQRPILEQVRPGVAYGHSTIVVPVTIATVTATGADIVRGPGGYGYMGPTRRFHGSVGSAASESRQHLMKAVTV